jgi:hypothetical protein
MTKISHKILLITVFLISLFGINLEEGKGEIPTSIKNCYDGDCASGASTAWTSTTAYIQIPAFPGCNIKVTYKYRQCNTYPFHTVQIYIEDFDVPNTVACAALYSYVNNANVVIAAHNATYVEQQIQNVLTYNNFMAHWNTLTPAEKLQYDCPDGPGSQDPNSGNWRYKTHFMKGACNGYCRVTNSVNGVLTTKLTPINCLDEFCCKVQIAYCVEDGSTNPPTLRILKHYDSGNINVQECEETTFSYTICDPGIEVTVLPCRSNCQELTINY